MPIDRESTLRQAEKLQLQGRLDLAIAEYVRLVEEQPRDWNSINALGDLYLRAGDADRGGRAVRPDCRSPVRRGFLSESGRRLQEGAESQAGSRAHAAAARGDRRACRNCWLTREVPAPAVGAAQRARRRSVERRSVWCGWPRLPEADAETILTGARAARALGDTAAGHQPLSRQRPTSCRTRGGTPRPWTRSPRWWRSTPPTSSCAGSWRGDTSPPASWKPPAVSSTPRQPAAIRICCWRWGRSSWCGRTTPRRAER